MLSTLGHRALVSGILGRNQVDGPSIIGTGTCGAALVTPEVPLALLLPLAGGAVMVGVGVRRRRRGAVLVAE